MDLKVINPYNQETVFTLRYDDEPSIARKIQQAQEAQAVWRGLPIARRIEMVREGLDRFGRRGEEVARDITLQMGKPLAQSRNELGGMRDRAETMLSIAEESLAPEMLPPQAGFLRRIAHVPLGLVFNPAAWNYPVLIPIKVVLPGLLAGQRGRF